MDFWGDIVKMVGFFFVAAIALEGLCRITLPKFSSQNKRHPRCRRCGYILLHSQGKSCPECGRAFKPKGVWPPGKPKRTLRRCIQIAWLWLMVSSAYTATSFYEAHQWEAIKSHGMYLRVAVLTDPKSDAYDYANISIGGQEWRWFPGDIKKEVAPVQATIWLNQDNSASPLSEFDKKQNVGNLAISTFNLATLRPEVPRFSELRSNFIYLHGSADVDLPETIADELIAGLEQHGPITNGPQLRAEIEMLIRLAVTLGDRPTVSSDRLPVEDVQNAFTKHKVIDYFDEAAPGDWSEGSTSFPPKWFPHLIRAFAFGIWMVGAIFIFAPWRSRGAVDKPA